MFTMAVSFNFGETMIPAKIPILEIYIISIFIYG